MKRVNINDDDADYDGDVYIVVEPKHRRKIKHPCKSTRQVRLLGDAIVLKNIFPSELSAEGVK